MPCLHEMFPELAGKKSHESRFHFFCVVSQPKFGSRVFASCQPSLGINTFRTAQDAWDIAYLTLSFFSRASHIRGPAKELFYVNIEFLILLYIHYQPAELC